jgi:hypothetical protein
MPSLPFRVTQTGISTTAGFTSVYFPDYMVRPFNIGIGVVQTAASSATYSIQHTFDYTGGSTGFISSNATWMTNTGISSSTSAFVDGNYAYPVTAIRLNVTAGSSVGSVTATFVQAG